MSIERLYGKLKTHEMEQEQRLDHLWTMDSGQ